MTACPFILNILLANAAGLLGLLAVLGFSLPWLLLLLPPLSIIYRVQSHYRASGSCRAPGQPQPLLYTHLADTFAASTAPGRGASGSTSASSARALGMRCWDGGCQLVEGIGGGSQVPEKRKVDGTRGERKSISGGQW